MKPVARGKLQVKALCGFIVASSPRRSYTYITCIHIKTNQSMLNTDNIVHRGKGRF